MMRTATLVGSLSVMAAIIGACYLIFADTYSSQSCSAVPGVAGQTCTSESGETLIEANGAWVLWLLAIPVAGTAALAATLVLPWPAGPTWVIGLFPIAASFITALTIGAFFLPAAILAVVAAALRS
jgi:hypothetical protein